MSILIGVETFIYRNNKRASEVGYEICKSISKLGFINRGVKDGGKLYVIKHTTMDSVLVECCFIDNKEDMSRYDSSKMAMAIVEGITGVSFSNNDKLYRVCVGSFKNKSNADECLDEVKKKGYKDAFICIK